jgi:hypothetical protein
LNIAGLPHANIKALMSKVDRVADLPALDTVAAGLSNDDLQKQRPRRIGLVVLYPIQAESQPQAAGTGLQPRTALGAASDVIGVGLVFPDAEGNGLGEVEYMASFAAVEVEDADEVAEEAIRELDRADEIAAQEADGEAART